MRIVFASILLLLIVSGCRPESAPTAAAASCERGEVMLVVYGQSMCVDRSAQAVPSTANVVKIQLSAIEPDTIECIAVPAFQPLYDGPAAFCALRDIAPEPRPPNPIA
jgi:hypothetical protein